MIIVIGKSGQLAQACAERFTQLSVPFACLGRTDIDVFDQTAIEQTLNNYSDITAIINASAYTAVDKAEEEREQALALNCTAVGLLSDYAKGLGVPFIHISTDYVFSGKGNTPYLPDDAYQPVNAYGETKMLGERAALSCYPEGTCILRTSWVYSEFGNNFVKTMLRLFSEREQVNVVMDQVGAPTSAHTLAKACHEVIVNSVTGVHHVCDFGVTSWYDFAIAIYTLAQKQDYAFGDVSIQPIGSEAFPTPAARPNYSVLSTVSLRQQLPDLQLSHWQAPLSDVIKRIQHTK
ncbi:dTDP-4-dehydrorhamnose reductase [Alteromonas sediminis]|uniref:dTDP-4-dehydrorhamnose reductase n=1 Tax=Alteromonas sediminis TaxID=2259342 RepID=A0A3N5Y2V9_9ALTE|nr:dTDP-4-dehydrorhamnose reductase [Alteromonas sediminis]RPJ68287.1 dTDP-4-dehydrorhamnose reductase [Alteromonas sediminis]